MILIIISGRSGSGKSVALHVLEDMGFYCIDNLPILLLPELVNNLAKQQTSIAVSIAIHNIPTDPIILKTIFKNLSEKFSTQLIFLDTKNDTLIKRYSNTRHIHPLFRKNLSLKRAIYEENNLLEPLRSQTNLMIDTTEMSVNELNKILRTFLLNKKEYQLNIIFKSFGFKYGIPIDADYVFDVRFLPNPHWDAKLRHMTGIDLPVATFLNKYTEVHHFINQTSKYLELWLPILESNNRRYLTIAIGCTGGKHRSVYIANQLANHFYSKGKIVHLYHQTLEIENNNFMY